MLRLQFGTKIAQHFGVAFFEPAHNRRFVNAARRDFSRASPIFAETSRAAATIRFRRAARFRAASNFRRDNKAAAVFRDRPDRQTRFRLPKASLCGNALSRCASISSSPPAGGSAKLKRARAFADGFGHFVERNFIVRLRGANRPANAR
jgi:hypothetical protein